MAQKQYVQGSGEIYLQKLDPLTKLPVEGERYIGNSTAFSISVASTTLDHFDSDHGFKSLDESVLTQVTRTGTFTTDNIDPLNLADFYLGDASTITATAATAVAESFVSIKQDQWYQLGVTANTPSGVRKITNAALTVTATPMVEGTDYEIDLELARFRVIPGSTVAADASTVSITYDQSASTRSQVISGKNTVAVAVRFIAFNEGPGGNRDYFLPYVKLTPNGEYQLKGDQWQQMQFNMQLLEKDSLTQAIYIDGRPA